MAKTTQQFSESDFCASQKHTVVEISRLEARTNQIETQQILRFCILQARRGSGGVRRCRFSGVSTDSAGDCPSGTKCCASAPPTARKAQDSPRNAEISDGTTQNRPKTSPQITPRPPKIKLPCWTANNRRCAWAPYVALPALWALPAQQLYRRLPRFVIIIIQFSWHCSQNQNKPSPSQKLLGFRAHLELNSFETIFGSCLLVMDPVDVVEKRISALEEKIFGKNKPNDNAVPVRTQHFVLHSDLVPMTIFL